ncbi:MAG: LamG domain-containing protein [bacterium]|nr:LamG domain-containing protein [bacterium]
MKHILSLLIISVFTLIFSSTSWAENEKGLVGYWSLDESDGITANDKTGNNHGMIYGSPERIPLKVGSALSFDGADDYIEVSESLDIIFEEDFTIELWLKTFDSWINTPRPLICKRSGNEGYYLGIGEKVSYLTFFLGDRDETGYAAFVGRDNVVDGNWHHVVVQRAKNRVRMFVDGILDVDVANPITGFLAGSGCLYIGSDHSTPPHFFHGILDEVRIYNRGLSAEEVLEHYKSEAKDKGVETRFDRNVKLSYHLHPTLNIIAVEVNVRRMWLPSGEEVKVEVELWDPAKKEFIQRQVEALPLSEKSVYAMLKVGDLASGSYEIRAKVLDQTGSQIGEISTEKLTWTERPKQIDAEMKVLNNFVAELLNVKKVVSQPHKEYKFFNPRKGWIFISTTADIKGSGKIWISIDSASKEEAVIIHEKEKDETLEAMRLLPAGEHKIHVWCEGDPLFKNLIVRSIPEIGFVTAMKWDLMKEYKILNNINLLVSQAGQPGQGSKIWKEDGKKWLVMTGVPGPYTTSVTLQDSYKYWAEILTQNPLVDGFIADEIGSKQPRYKECFPFWADAIRKLKKDFPDKETYLYCSCYFAPEKTVEPLKPIMYALQDCEGKLALEAYLSEKPTLEGVQAHIKSILRDEIPTLEKVFPGFTHNAVLAINTADKFGLRRNACPNIDYRVFLDMQFHFVATAPAWKGLYGIQNYHSFYMWEETQRWLSKLYRHYCIEGKTDLLSKEYGLNLMLNHIKNPDFEEGAAYWTLSDSGSMEAKSMSGLAWKQKRYATIPYGNKFLWTKRRADKPNIFSQEIKNLQPGKCYSIKMWVGDHKNLSLAQTLTASIQIENAEFIPEENIHQSDKRGDSYFTYFYRVFRAKGGPAKLVISDWASDKEPGGPIGQELMFNFIEVQPYLED